MYATIAKFNQQEIWKLEIKGNYYRQTRRNFYEAEEENEISNTGSEINVIQTESRDYNKERRTISPKRYDRRYSGN
jgi:hypothetical protein